MTSPGARGPTTLHVAAMPFPTVQGTQAAVGAMVGALAGAGRSTALLTYGHGLTGDAPPSVRWHRLRNAVPVRSMRSGPSVGKVALDAQLAWSLWRRYRRGPRPSLFVAHHVEACAAALAAGVRPMLFVAHTALGPELPAYLPRLPSAPVRRAAAALERGLVRRAGAVAAVCPSLAQHLTRVHGVGVHGLVVPWPTAPGVREDERVAARARLGVPSDASVALYAGNLDAYQGWEDTVAALAQVVPSLPSARLLVATASDPHPLRALAGRAGVGEHLHVVGIHGEPDRRAAHAAADVALVPRRTPGGLPIKLLDALGRGVPTILTRRASAGLPVEDAALVVPDDDGTALAEAWRTLAASPSRARQLGVRGRAYVQRCHGRNAFVASWDEAVAAAVGRPGRSGSP